MDVDVLRLQLRTGTCWRGIGTPRDECSHQIGRGFERRCVTNAEFRVDLRRRGDVEPHFVVMGARLAPISFRAVSEAVAMFDRDHVGTLRTAEDNAMTPTTITTHGDPIAPGAALRDRHLTIRRVMIALPPVTGSVLLLVLVLGWMGAWESVALAAWLACSALIVTRVGERAAVVTALGFRRPTTEQSEALNTLWPGLLRRAGLSYGDVDLYVHRSSEPNAYAAGRRSVAVTSGLLQQFAARRLTQDKMQALLAHELGHHATGATTGGLSVAWLALPWRFAGGLLIAVTSAAARRTQSTRSFLIVALTAVGLAVVQAAQQRHWSVMFVLCAIAFCVPVCPIASAALARRSEYAADRYADALGYGPQLASALTTLGNQRGHRSTLASRALCRHPTTGSRILAMDVALGPAPLTESRLSTGCA